MATSSMSSRRRIGAEAAAATVAAWAFIGAFQRFLQILML
jgi:hypothetical protein